MKEGAYLAMVVMRLESGSLRCYLLEKKKKLVCSVVEDWILIFAKMLA